MRLPATRGAGRLIAACVVASSLLAACSGAPPSVAPATPRPTPVITPDPHLADPTTADAVFIGLAKAGLRVTANNADAGRDGSPLVKRINATYLGWPLLVSQFETSEALTTATDWGETGPSQGEPPISIAGMNILVEWGPTTGAEPPDLDAARMDGLRDMAATLDTLLSPLRSRSIVAVPGISPELAAETEATPAP